MIENMKEFWYLYVLLGVLIIITVFVCKKAFGASSRHSKEINELLAKAKRNKELREAYKDITAQIIGSAPADSLFEGIALNMEAVCQKTENIDSFYNGLNDSRKKVYAFYYLATDAKEENLSAFFKASNQPLTNDAVEASKAILNGKVCKVISEMFDCYDENNENASATPQTVDRLNAQFNELTRELNLYSLGGEFIKKNPSDFINK